MIGDNMYKRKKKVGFKNKIIISVVIVLCLILSSVFINRNFNLPDGFIKDGILFVDRVVSKPLRIFDNDNYDELVLENENLRKKVEKLNIYEVENIELKEEIGELKGVLNINKLLSDKEYINASVINRNLDYWTNSLVIDKGSNDGVSDNMAVISNGSLIGVTNNVSNFNSNVSLLCNNKFPMNISVKIVFDDNELFGILNNYKDGFYEIIGIVENVDIPADSVVMTTGLGNIFPSGIMIGNVSSVVTDNFDLSKIVKVKPSADFDDIAYVTVVKREDK